MTSPVLVVDDDPDVREAISMALEARGHRVVTAGDGVECLERMRAERPGLVLLDLMMPRMNGWEVCEALTRDPSLGGVPVVILTGNLRATDHGLCAVVFLRKPVDLDMLLDVVERTKRAS